VTLLLLLVVVSAGFMLKRQWRGRAAADAVQQPVRLPPPAPVQNTEMAATAPTPSPPAAIEPQPASAPVAFGVLKVASSPEGAIVRIDGRSAPHWTTPFQARLQAGRHSISFDKPGFNSESMMVEVAAETTQQVRGTLLPLISKLFVTSDPSAASIHIDGQDSGRATPAQLTLQPGRHRVVLRKPGFQPLQTVADLSPGETVNVNHKLVAQADVPRPAGDTPKRRGLVVVRTRPPGAQITVAGRQLRKITPLRMPAPAGDFIITISKDGFRQVQRQVHVEAGQVTKIDVELAPQ
jgi:hypothetical protein